MTLLRLICACLIALWLAGCATAPGGGRPAGNMPPLDTNIDLSSIPPAIPKPEPLSEYGNPPRYTVLGETYYTLTEAQAEDFVQTGIASWYGRKFHGQRTSSGEIYNMYRMTAAHKTLPLPSYVRVTNLRNGRQVIVRVNDRGPFHDNRIIDLSWVAALKLGFARAGTAPVRIKTITAEDVDRRTARTADGTPAPDNRAEAVRTSAAASAASALYLQTGAFSRRRNARRITNRLKRMGITRVTTRTVRNNGTILYTVQVGPFSNPANRRAMRRRLTREGIAAIPVRQTTVR